MKEAYAIEFKLHVVPILAAQLLLELAEGSEFVRLSPRDKLLVNLTPKMEENDRETQDIYGNRRNVRCVLENAAKRRFKRAVVLSLTLPVLSRCCCRQDFSKDFLKEDFENSFIPKYLEMFREFLNFVY